MSTKVYYQIEYCIPEKGMPDEWTRLNEEFEDEGKLDKKLGSYRTNCPGRKWQIFKIKKEESLFLSIRE